MGRDSGYESIAASLRIGCVNYGSVWTGTGRSPSRERYRIYVLHDNTLWCFLADMDRYGWYEFKRKNKNDASPVKITSQQVAGKDVLVISKDGDEQRLGEYIPEKVISDAWLERLGNYQVSNPDDDFPLTEVCLTKEDDLLYFSYRMPRLTDKRISLPLTVLNQEQAITSGMGRGRGETLAVMQTDEGEYLFYSGYLVKKHPEEIESELE